MAVHGPDSGYSWVIVLCCAYIHFALFGLFRSAGVIYVAMLQNYDVKREEASWPFALCAAVFQLVGPAVSLITHYISQRKACLLGSAIATFGIAGCYFADSVMWINIFYGVIHGLGFGLVVTLVPVTLNQYFVKHRATAIGMAFSGGTISSLIFPSAMEWLLENYTLKDSFLLLSGVVMNTLVASSLLRAPPWLNSSTSDSKSIEDASEAKDSGVSSSAKESTLMAVDGLIDNRCDAAYRESSISKDSTETDKTLYQISEITNESQQDLSDGVYSNRDTVYSNNDSVLFDETSLKCELEKTGMNLKSEDFVKNESEVKEPLMGAVVKIHITPMKDPKAAQKHSTSPYEGGIGRSLRDILKKPAFHLLTTTMCIYFLGVHSFFMVIVDFAKDKGIPEAKGIYIISMFSLTDLCGRAGLGWVTDRNFISRRTMMALNLGALGILYQLYPLTDSLSGILVIAAFSGLAVGSSITLFFVLQAECFGMKQLTLVVGLIQFINGMMSLLRPGIIGLFRDVIGSYDWMFHFEGFNFLVFSIIWFVESQMAKQRSSNQIQNFKT